MISNGKLYCASVRPQEGLVDQKVPANICISTQAYYQGIGRLVARPTLADANELRDWRIYLEWAQRLARERAEFCYDQTCVLVPAHGFSAV